MKMQGNFQKKQQWGKIEVFALAFSAVITMVLFQGVVGLMQIDIMQIDIMQMPAEQGNQSNYQQQGNMHLQGQESAQNKQRSYSKIYTQSPVSVFKK